MARAVSEVTLARGEMAGLGLQLAADAGAAVVALLVATGLSIYKPPGVTPFGRRGGPGGLSRERAGGPSWPAIIGAVAVALIVLIVVLHMIGRGLGTH